MLLIAQRVRNASGASGINVAFYVHGPEASAALVRDPQIGLEDSAFAPKLMLTMKEVSDEGGRIVSLLDIAFADDLPASAVVVFVDRALLAWTAESAPPTIWAEGQVAVRFYASPERNAAQELQNLKAAMMPLFGHVVSRIRGEAPVQVAPPQPIRIRRHRGRAGDRYVLDPSDRAKLSSWLRRELPASFSIADSTKSDFEAFALVPLEHIVTEALTGVPLDALTTLGGAVIEDDASGDVLWTSTTEP